jgi:ABC-type Zn uptake system ZnuABC Zn-binding protein ZnuA
MQYDCNIVKLSRLLSSESKTGFCAVKLQFQGQPMRATMPFCSSRPFWRACSVVGLLLLSGGCGVSTPPQLDDGRLSVVATYSILGDWVHEVGGPLVEVVTLVGRGFETWLDKLFESSGSTAQRVAVTRGIDTQRVVKLGEIEERDPHVWHDPVLAISMVQSVCATIAPPTCRNGPIWTGGFPSRLPNWS